MTPQSLFRTTLIGLATAIALLLPQSVAMATPTLTAADRTMRADPAVTANPSTGVSGSVSGTVTSAGTPQAGAEVAAVGTTLKAVTDAAGRYRLALPHGAYDLNVTPASRCVSTQSAPVTVNGDLTKDFNLPPRTDGFGHVCTVGADPYIAGTHKIGPSGDWGSQGVALPFTFPMYGAQYKHGSIGSTGYMQFHSGYGQHIAMVYPYQDSLVVDDQAGVYTATLGTAPRRTFVVEWRNVTFRNDSTLRVSVSAALGEDGSIRFFYKDLDNPREFGSNARIGILNFTDGVSFWYSDNSPALSNGQSLTFTASGHGLVGGVVTDANDGKPVIGATVKIGADTSFLTDEEGRFYGQAPVGDHKAEVSRLHYGTFLQDVSITAGALTSFDTALITGRLSAESDEVTLIMPVNAVRSGSVELTNLGSATTYTVFNDAETWLTATPASGEVAAGASTTLKVSASSAGLRPGAVLTGTLLVYSNSGRDPYIKVTVRAVVPRHQIALDVGSTKDVVDELGDRWSKDGKYTAGGHGYIGGSRVGTTTRAIKGTSEQELFKSARESMLEYRFDNVLYGTYTVELGFADLRSSRPGQRVFDVIVEDELAVPALDLAFEAGTHTAVTKRYTVKVVDGRLNVRFAKRFGNTVVNTIRVFERPDKPLP
ncbi:Carboxypeptidase regulatory-like domain-containing protein [Sinosporangium album]|uniref:Carboxypeptidase regulatory-like domain-containing protein n=1 Tax=Sinosporangium album TaxID=504805 RepID=A0A1G7TKP0_9ACTN|nr:malectin domain-containing carbohydrate-binding protein [Sinosporangium album]SDG35672.1 Carboxypeptidase regulatory-like domain-containing protein [Sinosporangium album]